MKVYLVNGASIWYASERHQMKNERRYEKGLISFEEKENRNKELKRIEDIFTDFSKTDFVLDIEENELVSIIKFIQETIAICPYCALKENLGKFELQFLPN